MEEVELEIDIVERMKRSALLPECPDEYLLLMNDAAHEINRLRAELLAFERECKAWREAGLNYEHTLEEKSNIRVARADTDLAAPRMKE